MHPFAAHSALRFATLCVAALLLPPAGQGQSFRAHSTAEKLTIDGRLDEPAWDRAELGTDFTQLEPRAGTRASERTEVAVLLGDSELTIGVRLFDSDPAAIVAGEMERDAELGSDDSVWILLDTFDDDRNGYVFATNPNGARYDALITEEGRDVNGEWDGVWTAAASIHDWGWSVELSIPFSTIRTSAEGGNWGFNVLRMIRRKNEEVFWSAISREAANGYTGALYRVSLAGALTGIPAIESRRPLEIKPYLLASLEDERATSSTTDTELGVDIKWGVGRSLTLDLTANTDFAEVEADNLQVNLSRFSLFFPEKRDFFLEGAGVFEFGARARAPWEASLFKAFFSRRIGLEDGQAVPIEYGARLTGKVDRWELGLLHLSTDSLSLSGANAPQTAFSVGRVKRNLGSRSSVGAIFTQRSPDGSSAQRLYGIDAEIKPNQRWSINGFVARSDHGEASDSSDDSARGLGVLYQGPEVATSLDYLELEENFVADVGLQLRTDVRYVSPRVTWQPRIERGFLRNWWAELLYARFDKSSTGELETESFSISPIGFDTESGEFLWIGWQRDREALAEPFEISPGIVVPVGVHEASSFIVGFSSNSARRVTFNNISVVGGFLNGDIASHSPSIGLRLSKHLRTSTGAQLNDIDLPQGSFSAHLYTQRVDVSWTPRLRLNLLAQFNEAGETAGINARFHWIWRPGSDLFLVYNERYEGPRLRQLEPLGRQIILKFNYLWRR